MRVFWTETAARNLEEIRDFIAKVDPSAAAKIVRSIYDATQQLEHFPRMGRRYELRADTNLRELIVRKNFRVVYEITTRGVEIHVIAHCSRLLDL